MLADFRGVKKVYYNGSYYDSVRFGNELIWETLKEMEDVFKRSEVDLTGLDEQVWEGSFDAFNDEFGSFLTCTVFAKNLSKSFDYLTYVSIDDWFIVIQPEEIYSSNLNYNNFMKFLPPSYLERIFELPFPLGTYYDEYGELKNYKISLWFRKEV